MEKLKKEKHSVKKKKKKIKCGKCRGIRERKEEGKRRWEEKKKALRGCSELIYDHSR